MLSFNPLSWQNFDLRDPKEMRDFLKQLSQWAQSIQLAATLQGIISGNSGLYSALSMAQVRSTPTSGSWRARRAAGAMRNPA